jgi:hypothetical protein
MTTKQKAEIDNMSQEEMLRLIRFAPSGDERFVGEKGTYLLRRSRELQVKNPAGHVAASKRIGRWA